MDPCSQVGNAKTKTIPFYGTLRHVVCRSFGELHFEALDLSQRLQFSQEGSHHIH